MPGRDKNIFLGNIVYALNPGWPVVFGMGWPSSRAIKRTAFLDGKTLGKIMAMRLHSVAIEAPTEDWKM